MWNTVTTRLLRADLHIAELNKLGSIIELFVPWVVKLLYDKVDSTTTSVFTKASFSSKVCAPLISSDMQSVTGAVTTCRQRLG